MSVKNEPIDRLIRSLSRLPGIGEKTATRLAFHVLGTNSAEIEELARALIAVKREVMLCSTCFNITEQDPCRICTDDRRDPGLICVVEEPKDLFAIEKTRAFNGTYHVLHGSISPLDGIGPDEIKAGELIDRISKDGAREVILAMNPDVAGEATSLYIARELKPFGVQVSRIARGIPMGGDIEYTDAATLSQALQGRKDL